MITNVFVDATQQTNTILITDAFDGRGMPSSLQFSANQKFTNNTDGEITRIVAIVYGMPSGRDVPWHVSQ